MANYNEKLKLELLSDINKYVDLSKKMASLLNYEPTDIIVEQQPILDQVVDYTSFDNLRTQYRDKNINVGKPGKNYNPAFQYSNPEDIKKLINLRQDATPKSNTSSQAFSVHDVEGYDELNEILDKALLVKPTLSPEKATKWTDYINEVSKPYEEELGQKIKEQWSFNNPYGGNTSLFQEKANKLWASESARKAAEAMGLAEKEYNTESDLYKQELGLKTNLTGLAADVSKFSSSQDFENAQNELLRKYNLVDAETARQQFLEDREYQTKLQQDAMQLYKNMQPSDWDYFMQGLGQALPSVLTTGVTKFLSPKNPYSYSYPTNYDTYIGDKKYNW